MEITLAKVHEAARSHVRMYENRIRSGSPMVNVEECRKYLRIWNSVLQTRHPNDLTNEAELEILEACYCGDYEDIFGEVDDTPFVIKP